LSRGVVVIGVPARNVLLGGPIHRAAREVPTVLVLSDPDQWGPVSAHAAVGPTGFQLTLATRRR